MESVIAMKSRFAIILFFGFLGSGCRSAYHLAVYSLEKQSYCYTTVGEFTDFVYDHELAFQKDVSERKFYTSQWIVNEGGGYFLYIRKYDFYKGLCDEWKVKIPHVFDFGSYIIEGTKLYVLNDVFSALNDDRGTIYEIDLTNSSDLEAKKFMDLPNKNERSKSNQEIKLNHCGSSYLLIDYYPFDKNVQKKIVSYVDLKSGTIVDSRSFQFGLTGGVISRVKVSPLYDQFAFLGDGNLYVFRKQFGGEVKTKLIDALKTGSPNGDIPLVDMDFSWIDNNQLMIWHRWKGTWAIYDVRQGCFIQDGLIPIKGDANHLSFDSECLDMCLGNKKFLIRGSMSFFKPTRFFVAKVDENGFVTRDVLPYSINIRHWLIDDLVLLKDNRLIR